MLSFGSVVLKSLFQSKPSDWYKVSKSQIVRLGGSKLFEQYPTVSEALKAAYPEIQWDPLKFKGAGRVSNSYWTDIENQRRFVDRLALELQITNVHLLFSLSFLFLSFSFSFSFSHSLSLSNKP